MIILDGTNGIRTPGVENTKAETVAETLAVSGDATFGTNLTVTGNAFAATAAAGTNTTQLATTAFVTNKLVTGYAPIDTPTFIGTPTAPTPAVNDNTSKLATTAYVMGQDYAPINTPTFIGVPKGPTAAPGTSTTQLATTAFVNAQSYAPINSPAFTGIPTVIGATPPTNTSTTQIATTAFVQSVVFDASLVPQNYRTSAYILAITDIGKHIAITTGGITIPAGVFSIGTMIMVFNYSAVNQTITPAPGVTCRLSGSALTGNRLLAQWGTCTLLCVAANMFIITGAGVT